jgi:GH18 family chitinase
MAQSLDWFNIMTYEEHGPWDSTTPTGNKKRVAFEVA